MNSRASPRTLARCALTVLTDEVELRVAVGIAPQPTLGTVVARTVLLATGQIPERNRHLLATDPLPGVAILRITHRTHPVLGRGVAAVPSPQLPADETLQGRIALVDQRAAARPAERERIAQRHRLPVVEDVALAVVRGGRTGWLVAEGRTPLDRQGLVGVDERLADRQLARCARFQVHRHERTGHRWVARQEQWLSFLQRTGEPVADRIRAQIRPVVTDTHHDRGRCTIT